MDFAALGGDAVVFLVVLALSVMVLPQALMGALEVVGFILSSQRWFRTQFASDPLKLSALQFIQGVAVLVVAAGAYIYVLLPGAPSPAIVVAIGAHPLTLAGVIVSGVALLHVASQHAVDRMLGTGRVYAVLITAGIVCVTWLIGDRIAGPRGAYAGLAVGLVVFLVGSVHTLFQVHYVRRRSIRTSQRVEQIGEALKEFQPVR
jgi:hypothetical protein